jgi:membrane protein YqaA with SNARE-associated domain
VQTDPLSWLDLGSYALLFLTAFGAASILPFYSEALFIGMLVAESYNDMALWLTASAGNTLGAVLNWWMARYLLNWQDKRWFPVTRRQLEKASAWFQRYGVWTLLLAWAPIGGDALTFVAGIMRVRLGLFLILVGIGKSVRYAFVWWTAEWLIKT